ncbi:MAG: hypothetical protein KDA21_04075, partial [Phycisphaerales bacterium]|nr:hypothetical protein [Phycisphaerales bacterium]
MTEFGQRERGGQRSDVAAPGAGTGPVAGPDLEIRIIETGERLLAGLSRALESVPDARVGPQALARRLGLDKVLASRVLKTVKSGDPLAAIHRAPGPDPLRRVVRAMVKAGVDTSATDEAVSAIDGFERLIRDDVGDRSSLDAIVAAWVPEARKEFELRRKQSAFKALSQLKGTQADTLMASVFLHPAADGTSLDVVWINGLFGLHRLRPGAAVRFATRRIAELHPERAPCTLDGQRVQSQAELMLTEFCSTPTPGLEVHEIGESVIYTLQDNGFGPRSASNVVFAEANRGEVARFARPGVNRKTFVFAEVSTPSKVLQFDAFVHEDLFSGSDPSLRLYDTSFEGVADLNDPSRELDRLDMMESVESLGMGLSRCRSSDIGSYGEILRRVCETLDWSSGTFRGYRCRVDYPLYGTQVAMAWD